MLLRSLILAISSAFITFSSFGQLSAVHSAMLDMDLCDSQTGTITLTNNVNFLSNDAVFVVLPNNSGLTYNNFSVSSGNYSESGDTVIIDNLPSVDTVTLTYTTTLNCNSFNGNSVNLINSYSFALNPGVFATQSYNLNIYSPVLNYIGGNQLNFGNAILGAGTTRSFYYTNTSNTEFNGFINFRDTLPNALSNSAVTFDTVFLASNNGTLIDREITDSTVHILIQVSNLAQGDTLEIRDVAFLNSCVVLQNNLTKFELKYGCTELDLCQTVSSVLASFETTLNFDPNDKPTLVVLNVDTHHEACFNDTVFRTEMFRNDGPGIATGMKFQFNDLRNQFGVNFLDTASIAVYLNSVSPLNELNRSISLYVPNQDHSIYTVLADGVISPNDTIIIIYREINKCIPKNEYDYYSNQTIGMHDIWIRANFLRPCIPFAYKDAGNKASHSYQLNQQFNNLIGTIGDFEEKWFEIDNVGDMFFGNGLGGTSLKGIAYDLDNSLIEVEILLESGLSLVSTDSLLLYSTFGGASSYLPLEGVQVFYGLPGPDQFDTIRAKYSIPSNFQAPNTLLNSTTPPAHYPYKKTPDFYQFFANSSIKFKLKAYCDSVAPDSKAQIRENIYFMIDTNCLDCKLPLASVQDTVNILCPGCILPGWNLTTFEIERINLGSADTNNDHYPDSFSLQPITPGSTPQSNRAMIGDTLNFSIEGFITNGDPNDGMTFADLAFPFDEGQFLFKGDVGKLKFIGGSGTFIQGNTSTPFYVPAGSDDVYTGAIGLDMSIDSLISYSNGILNITSYNDSCSIVFNPQFRVRENFDDGTGSNPYFSLKNITAFYLMGGTPFGVPDLLDDANTQAIDSIENMSISERELLSYWCVGYDGRYIGIGANHTFYAPSFIKSGALENNDCTYRMTERFLGLLGDDAIISSGSINTAPFALIDPASSQAFPNELRDLYNLDSITYHFPSQLEVYGVEIKSHSYYIDTTTFLSAWSGVDIIPNTSALYTTTPTSITIYPEMFQHSNTSLTNGDNHGTYDENIHYNPTIFLRNSACYIIDTVPILYPFIDNHFSNFPGAVNGDTTISVQMTSNVHSTGIGQTGYLDFPNPTFDISTNSISPQLGSNLGFEIDYGVIPPLPYSNYTHLLSRTDDIAYNSFMSFESPNGNFTNIVVPVVDNISTNYSTQISTTTTGAPGYTDIVSGNLLIGTGTLGGDTYHQGYSKQIYMYADYDCSSIPIGGMDSLYLIYGWNCFDYPDTLEEACFVDTFVLYINAPNTGLSIEDTIISPVSLCDTIHYSALFDPTGEGDVNNITVEIFNDGLPIDYVAGSGQVTYDNSTYAIDPVTSPLSHLWILDSLNAGLEDFNGLSPNAIFSADFLVGCGVTDDTLIIALSATNYCGQVIYADSFKIIPQTFYDLPIHDSLSMSGTIDSFTSCSDTNTVTITVNNDGQTSSNTNNELQIVIPDGYAYVSGGAPSYNTNDTLIFPLSSIITGGGSYSISIEITKTDSTCQRSFLTSQILLNSPYYCDTNECFYSSTTPSLDLQIVEVNPGGFALGTVDPSPMCSGIDEITIDFSSQAVGTIEVYDANTSTYLGQGNYQNTSGSGGQFTISLSDSSSNLFFINTSPCCPDTIYYSFDCDTICQADASFDISNYCLGDTITVTSSETLGTHEWTYSYFGLTSTGTSASFPAAQAGSHSIQHIFNATCGASDTVVQTFLVNIPIQSSIVLNGTNPICQPDSALLSIQNGLNFTDFLWTTGDTSSTIWVSTSGTYGVTIVDSNGCTTDGQAITITSLVSPTPINDTIYICDPLDTVELDAGTYPVITWNDGSSGQFNTVTGPGQFTAIICDSSATCCSTNTYTVIVSDFIFTIPDTISCETDSTLITANFSAITYVWSNGNNGNSSYYLNDGTHWLTATNEFGCAYTDSFTITTSILPISDFTIDDTICTSDSITCLYPTIDDPSFDHHWIFDLNGSQYNNYTSSPCFDFGDIGTFPITHIVTNACGSDTTIMNVTVIEFDSTANIILIGQNPLCSGNSVQLTPSSDFVSIEWHDGIGNSLVGQDTLTVYSGGIYAATITDSNGCSRTLLTTINENPTPSISVGAVTDPIGCNSSTGSIELTGSGTGNINWTGTGSGNANSVTLPYVITGLNAGTYNITFEVNGCTSNALQVSLTDPPTPTVIASGTATICEGESALISATGASSYSWDNGAGTNSNATVSPISTTTYTVTGISNGCTATDQVTITVLMGTSSSDTVYLCTGLTVTIGTSTYNSAGVYTDTVAVTGACDNIVTTTIIMLSSSDSTQYVQICEGETYTLLGSSYTDQGTYTNITVNAAGCDSIITTVLTVTPIPTPTMDLIDTTCFTDPGPITLIATPSGGIFSGPGVSGSTFSPNSAGVGSHTIVYEYTDQDTGCIGTDTVIAVVEKCAGIKEIGLEGVSLFPNPNEGKFNVVGLEIGTAYEIFDDIGRLVLEGVTKSEHHEIDLPEVQVGMYYLYATHNGVKGSIKFLITK